MFRTIVISALAALLVTSPAFAQELVVEGQPPIEQAKDCDNPDNADEAECLLLPLGGDQITNFVPLFAPLLGAAAVAAVAAGGGSTTSTTSTTN